MHASAESRKRELSMESAGEEPWNELEHYTVTLGEEILDFMRYTYISDGLLLSYMLRVTQSFGHSSACVISVMCHGKSFSAPART